MHQDHAKLGAESREWQQVFIIICPPLNSMRRVWPVKHDGDVRMRLASKDIHE